MNARKVEVAEAGGKRAAMLRKRSVTLAGHATSLALEPEFWAVLEAMAGARGLPLSALVAQLDDGRGADPLASACRVAALRFALDGGKAGDRNGVDGATPSAG